MITNHGAANAKGVARSFRVLLCSGVALACAGAGAIGHAIVDNNAQYVASHTAAATPPGSAPLSFAALADRVKPAVVSIKTRIVQQADAPTFPEESDLGRLLRRYGVPFNGMPSPPLEGFGQGSGFFISADGYIVTNNHVVRNAREVSVTLDDGKTIPARVVGTDPRTDLAVLKTTTGSNYPFVRLASSTPRVGDWVVAVGNPFGLGGTVTAGIVSARGRDIQEGPADDFLQIDAPINRGNSGGPTFNLNGEVVGINTAIYSPSGGSVGIGFAIPATSAAPVIDALKRGAPVERAYLGVSLQPVDDEAARALKLADTKGALIAEVATGGPAGLAGIRAGDVVVRADAQAINTPRDLARAVATKRPGTRMNLEFWRDGTLMRREMQLATSPPQNDA